MKKQTLAALALIIALSTLSACSSSGAPVTKESPASQAKQTEKPSAKEPSSNKNDSRDIEYFKNAFEKTYTLKDIDKPAYAAINASDGIIFYIDNDVVKIYQYKDEEKYKKALEDFAFVKTLPKNGMFVAESSSNKLLEFFKEIK